MLANGETSVKVAWGKLWTCIALECPGGTTEHTSYTPPAADDPDEEPKPHYLPSLLTQEALGGAIQYALELKYVQATCLNGCIPLRNDAPLVQVFMPYRPVGSHG
jgi:hypothetical protein